MRTVDEVGSSGPALVAGLAKLVLAALLPVLMIWVLMHLDRLGEWTGDLLRRCHLLPSRDDSAGAAPGPPVEKLAADLRRLSAAVRDMPRGTSRARQHGLLTAYDEVLAAAGRALDVPQSLETLPLGLDRDLERLRVEGALEAAGLRFSPRRRQDTP